MHQSMCREAVLWKVTNSWVHPSHRVLRRDLRASLVSRLMSVLICISPLRELVERCLVEWSRVMSMWECNVSLVPWTQLYFVISSAQPQCCSKQLVFQPILDTTKLETLILVLSFHLWGWSIFRISTKLFLMDLWCLLKTFFWKVFLYFVKSLFVVRLWAVV